MYGWNPLVLILVIAGVVLVLLLATGVLHTGVVTP